MFVWVHGDEHTPKPIGTAACVPAMGVAVCAWHAAVSWVCGRAGLAMYGCQSTRHAVVEGSCWANGLGAGGMGDAQGLAQRSVWSAVLGRRGLALAMRRRCVPGARKFVGDMRCPNLHAGEMAGGGWHMLLWLGAAK